MPVQQHVLNWLYSVLTSEYHDVNRTYNDVAQALTQCPSLSPRTDVHTFSNGSSALLLHLTGTIPVNFRGSTYRFPVSIWVPHAYPREPPLVYVTPTETMMVRPGQHVDPQGQVYHPYLVGWAQFWDKSNLQDFMSVLSDIFAKEPPVVTRQADRLPRQQQQQPNQAPPPLPPLPQEIAPRPAPTSQSSVGDNRPPPPPPPPKEHQASQSPYPGSPSSTGTARPSVSSRYDSAPPLPPQVHTSPPIGRQNQPHPSPYNQQHQQQYPPQPQMPPGVFPSGQQGVPTQQPPYSPQSLPPQHPTQWQSQGQPPPGYAAPAASMQPPIQQQQAPPPPNILDEPLTLDIPANTAVSPPPIPPNPEKDNLLRQLAETLFVIRQRSRQQNDSSLAGLQAQRNAMQHAMASVHSESSQLTQLSNVLTSNTNILHDALRKADSVIEGSRSHPAPDIDELLVAPTVVSNQLYNLVAEERALGDAIFMLGRAVERGRIPPTVFAKTTRSLAREWYLKKALVRKIGQGMGIAL
ncbi:Suppressor protein stp22 of temperature-sensitive alpha-factor receptor and arginine permease [Conoideocrella luteorostrata]|uniref:Suppressor protein stp22 of temperature-sensitive alpha-factor receptor and arginine permease n=1 Tax=Conoideocrella luteorostrata TaxID=1105319 RepID=A0AAJ0CCJ1_9HYPO|nr:Suppressor protein stp22 of temperature-sensitive alpha-factor receptor and arginine permease [Conoideocrella luteorostrata]